MKTTHLIPILCFLCCCFLQSEGNAQALLSPPFGLKWGDNPSKLMDWADGQKLDITINLSGADPNKRHIIIQQKGSTLPGQQVTSLEARFDRNLLYEVTLHYADPKLTVFQAKTQFINAKKALTARHGPFKLSSNSKQTKNSFTSESLAYHVEPVSGLFVMIVYSEITDQHRNTGKSKFSIIYRNDNIVRK